MVTIVYVCSRGGLILWKQKTVSKKETSLINIVSVNSITCYTLEFIILQGINYDYIKKVFTLKWSIE